MKKENLINIYPLIIWDILVLFFILITTFPLTSFSSTFVPFPTKIDTIQERINVQVILNRVMSPSPNLKIDGVLGKKSIQAIQAFQESRGLVADGKVGPITRGALENAQTGDITSYTPTTSSTIQEGCLSGYLFSTLTGQPCTTSQSYSSGCEGNNKYNTLTGELCNTSVPTTSCYGSAYSSCSISNGQGIKSRTCNSGVWSSYGTCILTSCNNGYQVINNTCIATTCTGSSTQSCIITNGTGIQSRTCNSGIWSSYGTCSLTSCNSGYTTSGNTCIVVTTQDTTAPTITSFTIPSISSSLSVPISSFTATDNTGVTGYLLNESSSTPNASSGSWTTSPSSIYTFISEGLKTLYAWAKDTSGNISNSLSRSTTITLPLPVCTPEPTSTTCLNKCGSQINNCGSSIDCGSCSGGDVNYSPSNYNIILSNDFEDNSLGVYNTHPTEWEDDWKEEWNWFKNNDIVSIVQEGNTKVMQFIYPKGTTNGEDQGTSFYCSNCISSIEDDIEVYLSYNVMFRPGFDFVISGKIAAGIIGGEDWYHTGAPYYDEGFRARASWHKATWNQRGYPKLYIYHHDMPYDSGDSKPFLNSDSSDAYYFDTSEEKWYNITLRIVLNSVNDYGEPGNYDGIVEGYIDGELAVQWDGLRLRNVEDINFNIMHIYSQFGGMGSEFATTRDEWMLTDDYYVWTYSDEYLSSHSEIPRGRQLSPTGRTIVIPGMK